MEGPMKGWTKSEALLILECLTKVDFDELQKKIPDKNRTEIKEAVLFTVRTLADAPPRRSGQSMSEAEWTQFIIHHHKTGELHLPPPELAVPYIIRLVTCFKEFFHQLGNGYEGRPVAPDSVVLEILRLLASDLQAFYDITGGDEFPNMQGYQALTGTNIPIISFSRAPKYQPKKDKKKKDTKNASATPPTYSAANTNYKATLSPPDNPPVYTPTNQNIPQYMFDLQVSNVNPPKYTSLHPQLPIYVPSTSNITSMYGPTMNTPAKIENPPMYLTASKSNIPSMISSVTCSMNSMYVPATNHVPTPVYVLTNNPPLNAMAKNNLQPPMNATANNLPPPIYHHPTVSQTQPTMNGLVSNYLQPATTATATSQHNLINASANNFNPIYGPVQNNSYNPTNTNIMPSYVGAGEGNFERSNVPTGSSRPETASRHAENVAHHAVAGPNTK